MRHSRLLAALTALYVGSALCGCAPTGAHTLGAGPVGALTTVKATSSAAGPVSLTGMMVEKCPVSACWFKLQDRTGIVTVDVKAAGFVVADVPVGATVTAYGTVDTSGAEPVVHATGMRW